MASTIEDGLKRAACLIASQLPDDEKEALRVLDYAGGIVRHLKDDKAGGGRAVILFSPGVPRGPVSGPKDDREVQTYSPGKANPA